MEENAMKAAGWNPGNDLTDREREGRAYYAEISAWDDGQGVLETIGTVDKATYEWGKEYEGVNAEICERCGCSPCQCVCPICGVVPCVC